MHAFIEHARALRERSAGSLAPLAAGQAPLALFITCSDSRVIPSMITGAGPGELFELRTAGGIVPPYSLAGPTAEAATIEFAVQILGVADIVVCGHSHCAAVGALTGGADLTAAPAMSGWLTHAAPDPGGDPGGDPAERHVLAQLDRLRAHPTVRDRHAQGRLGLHGWVYEVHTGTVLVHRPGHRSFLPL